MKNDPTQDQQVFPLKRRTLLGAAGAALLSPLLPKPRPAEAQAAALRFAVIGDFGLSGQPEADVAALVKSWSPEFVATTGDNNYENGGSSTIDVNIGEYYHDFIYPYKGSYGNGAPDRNRFFPCLGNHDWYSSGAAPYLNYFTLPGNERYYEFVWGPVHLFMLDSDTHEPDGTSATSIQANWLRSRLAASTAPWRLVLCHHSPYSSGMWEKSTPHMQWPFAQWGASAVMAGHSHQYERLIVGGLPYFVNGLGGDSLAQIGSAIAGSHVRYNGDYGAMLLTADSSSLRFQFITRAGIQIDDYTLSSSTHPPPPPPPAILAPSNLTVTAPAHLRIDLNWKDNSNNENGFALEWSYDDVNYRPLAKVGANVTYYRDRDVYKGDTYYYRLRAYNSSGYSAYTPGVPVTVT